MPEYLSPGVYVEEFEIGAKPIEGVGTSTAGFLGMTERGPLAPRLVTSFSQFARLYGGYIPGSYTAYAINGFFTNGGQRCFIGRVAKENAVTATGKIGNLDIEAIGPGAWGNRIRFNITKASSEEDDLFKLTIAYFKGEPPEKTDDYAKAASLYEEFDDLSMADFIKRINGASNLIKIDDEKELEALPGKEEGYKKLEETAGSAGDQDLTSKAMQGSDDASKRTGLNAFKEVDEIAILCAPDFCKIDGEDSQLAFVGKLFAQCETLKDRFAIVNFDKNERIVTNLKIDKKPLRPSKYGAVYYPWIYVMDPLTKRKKLIPPSGHMAGIYARSDQERGVHKAPANELVRGALELEFPITKGEQDILNPRNINCIRSFSGRGILVWGARTMILDALWKYVNVRRLFIYIEESIEEGTQWVVFEPNDEKLWGRVRATITQFLTGVWRSGALMGTSVDEAFYVKCDRSTMSQDDIDNGRLICEIGISPVKPAEFVIFRIAQWTGGSAVSE